MIHKRQLIIIPLFCFVFSSSLSFSHNNNLSFTERSIQYYLHLASDYNSLYKRVGLTKWINRQSYYNHHSCLNLALDFSINHQFNNNFSLAAYLVKRVVPWEITRFKRTNKYKYSYSGIDIGIGTTYLYNFSSIIVLNPIMRISIRATSKISLAVIYEPYLFPIEINSDSNSYPTPFRHMTSIGLTLHLYKPDCFFR